LGRLNPIVEQYNLDSAGSTRLVTVKGKKRKTKEGLDIETEVDLVHNILYWAASTEGFFYTLGGPQPKRVR